MRSLRLVFGTALACFAGATGAQAHVELAETTAPAGAVYRAVLGVGHGCGEAATTGLRVLIDERLGSPEPEAKPGWTIEVVRADAALPGASLPAVRQIGWLGGNLPSAQHDEFVFTVLLPRAEPGTLIYFPVVQACGSEVLRWIETPLTGERPDALLEPAPYVTLTEAAPAENAP